MLNMLKILKMNKILFFSFGFSPTATTVTSGVTHLQNQVYDICFRRASGYCYICYVSYFCNLIWWLTFWTLIIPICAPSKTVKGEKKEEELKSISFYTWGNSNRCHLPPNIFSWYKGGDKASSPPLISQFTLKKCWAGGGTCLNFLKYKMK